MISLDISDDDKHRFNHERQYHPHPRVRQRMEVLWLKSQGLPHKTISQLADITSTTLTRYLKCYRHEGLEGLLALNFNQPQSALAAHRDVLSAHFKTNPPATARQAMADIERLTGLKRSENRVRIFLQSLSMARRKTGMVPAKADVDVAATFKKRA